MLICLGLVGFFCLILFLVCMGLFLVSGLVFLAWQCCFLSCGSPAPSSWARDGMCSMAREVQVLGC